MKLKVKQLVTALVVVLAIGATQQVGAFTS